MRYLNHMKLFRHILILSKETSGGSGHQISMLQSLKKHGYKTTIFLFKPPTTPVNFKYTSINKPYPNHNIYKLFSFIKHSKTLNNIIKKSSPKIIICIDPYSTILTNLTKTSIPTISIINNNIRQYSTNSNIPKIILKNLLKNTYKKSNRVICVSKGVAIDAKKYFNIKPESLKVIYDGVDINQIKNLSKKPIPTTHQKFLANSDISITGAGRFNNQKDFSTIINSIKILTKKNHHVKCLLIGNGPNKPNLENQINKHKLSQYIKIIPWQKNIHRYLSKSSLFIFSSNYEGLGLLILESLAIGTPPISTDTNFGPKEILTDKLSILLIPKHNPTKMADKILEISSMSPKQKEQLSHAMNKRIKSFKHQQTIDNYIKIISNL